MSRTPELGGLERPGPGRSLEPQPGAGGLAAWAAWLGSQLQGFACGSQREAQLGQALLLGLEVSEAGFHTALHLTPSSTSRVHLQVSSGCPTGTSQVPSCWPASLPATPLIPREAWSEPPSPLP